MAVTNRYIDYLLDGFKVVIKHKGCGPVWIGLVLRNILQ